MHELRNSPVEEHEVAQRQQDDGSFTHDNEPISPQNGRRATVQGERVGYPPEHANIESTIQEYSGSRLGAFQNEDRIVINAVFFSSPVTTKPCNVS